MEGGKAILLGYSILDSDIRLCAREMWALFCRPLISVENLWIALSATTRNSISTARPAKAASGFDVPAEMERLFLGKSARLPRLSTGCTIAIKLPQSK